MCFISPQIRFSRETSAHFLGRTEINVLKNCWSEFYYAIRLLGNKMNVFNYLKTMLEYNTFNLLPERHKLRKICKSVFCWLCSKSSRRSIRFVALKYLDLKYTFGKYIFCISVSWWSYGNIYYKVAYNWLLMRPITFQWINLQPQNYLLDNFPWLLWHVRHAF